MLNVDECVKLRELADISDGEVEMEVEVEVFQPRLTPHPFATRGSQLQFGLLSLVLMFALLPPLKFYPRLQYKFNFTFLLAQLPLTANSAQKCTCCSPGSVHFDGSSLVLAAAKFHTHKLFLLSI